MKNIYLGILIITILFSCGCTQNDGHLGELFGSWTLNEITKDGVTIEKDENNTIFSFQNEIVQVTLLVEPPYTVEYRYGNFTHNGNILTMQFQAKDSDYKLLYKTPDWLYFPEGGNPITFAVKTLTDNHMTIELKTDETVYAYNFKKTH